MAPAPREGPRGDSVIEENRYPSRVIQTPSRRLRVALVNDYEVVLRGLQAMLAPELIEVVELDLRKPPAQPVDIALYDTFAQEQSDGGQVVDLIRRRRANKVAIYSWNVDPYLIKRAEVIGASAYLSKALTGRALTAALLRVQREPAFVLSDKLPSDDTRQAWPGKSVGLTGRESEMLALITQGLTNQEIAERAYLSINSVKSYIRSAYRKLGISRRAEAVAWGMEHGMAPRQPRRDS